MLLRRALPFLVLFFCLALPAIQPEVSNVAYFVFAAIGLGLVVVGSGRRIVLKSSAVTVPLVSILGLAITFWAATGSPMALLSAYVFAPLALVGPFAATLETSEGRLKPAHIGVFASMGASAAAVVALYDRFVLGLAEPGSSVNNPIHFAGLAVTLAFVSLVGLYSSNHKVRLVSTLGFVAGVLALWLSSARGPLVALPGMVAMGLAVVILQRLPKSLRIPVGVGGLVLSVAAVTAILASGLVDSLPGFGEVARLVRDGTFADRSTRERLDMYQAAWHAWLASPVVGHGLANFVQIAASYVPEIPEFPIYEHLHSDSADFAVVGGTSGILFYLAILGAPLFAALRAERTLAGSASVFLAATVTTGYALMGLTNAMFGLLTQTVLFSAVCALVACLAGSGRRKPHQR